MLSNYFSHLHLIVIHIKHEYNHFSHLVSAFHERIAPKKGYLVGYAAILNAYSLQVPTPHIIHYLL